MDQASGRNCRDPAPHHPDDRRGSTHGVHVHKDLYDNEEYGEYIIRGDELVEFYRGGEDIRAESQKALEFSLL